MKYLSVNNCSKRFALLAILLSFSLFGFSQVPERPVTPYAVNDYSSIFSSDQRLNLENQLVKFSAETSNRIVVVTIDDLGGMDPSSFAFELGEKWGVGNESFDNGVVILIKPKIDNQRGEVFIAIGYGLEGVVPDAIAKRIVEQEMIPHFKENDYYSGVKAALKVIIPLIKGEISKDEYGDVVIFELLVFIFSIAFILLVIIRIFRGPKNIGGKGGGDRKGLDIWDIILIASLFSRGSGGSHSSGSFGGGGFGGGFRGGFGGGSFGGGGAGGSW